MKIVALQKNLRLDGKMNAYETTLYHGILVHDQEVLVLTSEVDKLPDKDVHYIYNVKSGATVTSPLLRLIVQRSVLSGWVTIKHLRRRELGLGKVVSFPLEEYVYEKTVPLRLQGIAPKTLLLKGDALETGPKWEFEELRFASLASRAGAKDAFPTIDVVRMADLDRLRDDLFIPANLSLLQEVQAIYSGNATLLSEELWNTVRHSFPSRYWVHRVISRDDIQSNSPVLKWHLRFPS